MLTSVTCVQAASAATGLATIMPGLANVAPNISIPAASTSTALEGTDPFDSFREDQAAEFTSRLARSSYEDRKSVVVKLGGGEYLMHPGEYLFLRGGAVEDMPALNAYRILSAVADGERPDASSREMKYLVARGFVRILLVEEYRQRVRMLESLFATAKFRFGRGASMMPCMGMQAMLEGALNLFGIESEFGPHMDLVSLTTEIGRESSALTRFVETPFGFFDITPIGYDAMYVIRFNQDSMQGLGFNEFTRILYLG